MGRVAAFFLSIFMFFIVTIFCASFYFIYWTNSKFLISGKNSEYYVSKGSSLNKIINDFYNKKYIDDKKMFYIYYNFINRNKDIKYGTYLLEENETPKSFLDKLILGKNFLIKVTIPEGLNIYQVAEKFNLYFPSVSKQNWINYFSNSNLISTLKLSKSIVNLEGFIYPDTYFFDPNSDPDFIIRSILKHFKNNITSQMFEKASEMGLDQIQYVTLSSIVEKETSISSERNLVSGVYWNRIKRQMKLQADPTVIYGIWDRYNGSLTKNDLLTYTPYNTYTFVGLPKGPIANPSLESFLAVLSPAHTDALYFVATGKGGHIFSRTLAEHNRAVEKYLNFLKAERKN
jgi:UPF0755 protein